MKSGAQNNPADPFGNRHGRRVLSLNGSYLGVAREEGISEEEIGAVRAIVMAVSAGAGGGKGESKEELVVASVWED